MQTKGINLPVEYNQKVWVKQIQRQLNMLIWQNINATVFLKVSKLLHPKMKEKENQTFVLLTIKSGRLALSELK